MGTRLDLITIINEGPIGDTLRLTIHALGATLTSQIMLYLGLRSITLNILYTTNTLRSMDVLRARFLTQDRTRRLLQDVLRRIITLSPRVTQRNSNIYTIDLILQIISDLRLLNLALEVINSCRLGQIRRNEGARHTLIRILTGNDLRRHRIIRDIRLNMTS